MSRSSKVADPLVLSILKVLLFMGCAWIGSLLELQWTRGMACKHGSSVELYTGFVFL